MSSSNKTQSHVGVLGADFYPPPEQRARKRAPGRLGLWGGPAMGLGEGEEELLH